MDTVTFHVGSDFYNKDFVDTMPMCINDEMYIFHWELFMTNQKVCIRCVSKITKVN